MVPFAAKKSLNHSFVFSPQTLVSVGVCVSLGKQDCKDGMRDIFIAGTALGYTEGMFVLI